MPGGEIFFYFFVVMIVMAAIGVILFLCSVAWAFSESKFAKIAYMFSLVLILLANSWMLLNTGLRGWAINWRVMPTGTALFALLTVWIVGGVPLVRWIRHRLSAAEEEERWSPKSVGAIRLAGIVVLVAVAIAVFTSIGDRSRTGVSGRVVDESGRPVQGIEVGLMYDHFETGGAHVEETDSEGRYRLDPVRPGEYYLTARPVPPYISDANHQPAGTVVPEEIAAQGLGYLFTFYPNAAAAENARKIVINQGDDLTNMDIVVPQARTPSLSGVVLLPGGEHAAGGRVTLHGEGWYRFAAGGSVGEDGTFKFPAVWPGNYRATTTTRYVDFEDQDCASLPITVADKNIDGLVLTVAPVARIKGKATGPDLPDLLRMPQVQAHPDGAISTFSVPNSGDLRVDWTFNIAGACGSTRLLVEGLPEGWYVESMRLGDRDITDQAVDFGPEAGDQEVEIVVGSDAPMLTVDVVDDQTGARRRGGVVVFPEDSSLWTYGSRFIAHSWATEDRIVMFQGLPPGDYLVAAITGAPHEARRYTTLQYLSAAATPVHMEAGQKVNISVSPNLAR